MKLLINICAHDGIISHYTGVGTMVGRYIAESSNFCKKQGYDYKINLLTPEYNIDSFGYSAEVNKKHSVMDNTDIIQVSNGTNGKVNFGTVETWQVLCNNTANVINAIDKSGYDKVITLCNDAPFAGLIELLAEESNHMKVWIPHSTIKIHKVDSAIPNSEQFYMQRLNWEQGGIDFINSHNNCFVGCVAEYLRGHLIDEYNLSESKAVNIINGEDLKAKVRTQFSSGCEALFEKIKDCPCLIMSFGRAEDYKNLDAAFDIGKAMGISSLVVAQSYYKEQPILDYYRERAVETGGNVLVDPPFDFPKFVIKNFEGKLIVLIPSKAEIFGLIINEVRKFNRDNVLIVANNVGGLPEQIRDGIDGVLIDVSDAVESGNKISKYLDAETLKNINEHSQITLQNKYNFEKIYEEFVYNLIGGRL
jgi:glycosyltransferase involved in cell wall biosynthesis